jgi:hypothetical protein
VLKIVLKVKDGAGELLVGGVRRVRHRLAGSVLRREVR